MCSPIQFAVGLAGSIEAGPCNPIGRYFFIANNDIHDGWSLSNLTRFQTYVILLGIVNCGSFSVINQ